MLKRFLTTFTLAALLFISGKQSSAKQRIDRVARAGLTDTGCTGLQDNQDLLSCAECFCINYTNPVFFSRVARSGLTDTGCTGLQDKQDLLSCVKCFCMNYTNPV